MFASFQRCLLAATVHTRRTAHYATLCLSARTECAPVHPSLSTNVSSDRQLILVNPPPLLVTLKAYAVHMSVPSVCSAEQAQSAIDFQLRVLSVPKYRFSLRVITKEPWFSAAPLYPISPDLVMDVVPFPADVYRLAGGPDVCTEGRVEMREEASAVWEHVCDDDWGDLDASVVCRLLGFK